MFTKIENNNMGRLGTPKVSIGSSVNTGIYGLACTLNRAPLNVLNVLDEL
jgi:hypothetical protein